MSPFQILSTKAVIFMLLVEIFGGVSSVPHESQAPPTPTSSRSPAEDETTRQTISNILADIQAWQLQKPSDGRPFFKLTFAQSLDGKIALKTEGSTATSCNLPLSGQESLLLTHGLRSIHDAILVGGNTLSTDNPRLSNRLWGENQPRPIVLDTRLEHVRKLGSLRKAHHVVVCCSLEAARSVQDSDNLASLELLPCECDTKGRLILRDVLKRLQDKYRISSVMVEGGASVHTAFLSERLVDCLCITIAPKILGNERGLACFARIPATLDTQDDYIDLASAGQESRFVPLGNDCIYLCDWSR